MVTTAQIDQLGIRGMTTELPRHRMIQIAGLRHPVTPRSSALTIPHPHELTETGGRPIAIPP
ncbi:hypothetical protein AORI_5544 [Amycolatopsis keratiniphila]|uniref:Uncharacterized protein n=1 Tax=Amycolatopsis keratiniphila TaxID=129921 RepID=R4TBC4_9PSEU|nr:hypothetical protein AORI_5544 [Amycolatopsis keratiniphila]